MISNKDVNLEIMRKMDDSSLFNFCLVNKSASKLCRNEYFWRDRFIQKFGKIYGPPVGESWKSQYLKFIYYLNLPKEKINFKNMEPEILKYFEKLVEEIILEKMEEEFEDLICQEPFENKEKYRKSERGNILEAAREMFEVYKQDDELERIYKGIQEHIYREFLFGIIDPIPYLVN